MDRIKFILTFLLLVGSLRADQVIKTPTRFTSPASITIDAGVPTIGFPGVQIFGTPANHDIGVWRSGTEMGVGDNTEVMKFTDDSTTFVPFWDTSPTTHIFDRLILSGAFQISGVTPNKLLSVIWNGIGGIPGNVSTLGDATFGNSQYFGTDSGGILGAYDFPASSGATIASTTNAIIGDGAGNGADSKIALTTPATGATITIADGKTFTLSRSVTLTALNDVSTLNIKTGGTLGSLAFVDGATGVATFLADPSTANFVAMITGGTTGTGKFVFDTSPQLSAIELGAATDTTLSRLGAGSLGVEGVAVLLSGGSGGTPSSIVLTNGTGLPLTTGVTGVLPVANGGTNIASYAVGDLLYASGSTTLSKLADVATGSVLISGGVTTAPAWSTAPPFTGTNISGTAASLNIGGSAASLSISGQTGLLTFTGLTSTSRAKTVRDAADTILEQGGSYAPTGNWDFSGASSTAGLKLPSAAGAVPTTEGILSFDTTNHWPVWGSNGVTRKAASQAGTEALTNKTVNGATISIADPVRVYVNSLTVLTSGSPGDIGTITVPAAIGRWTTAGTASTTSIFLIVAETASGTLASGQFLIRDATAGGGNAVTATIGGPTVAGGIISGAGVLINSTATTLTVRQTVNSGNAGTISCYLTLYPIP